MVVWSGRVIRDKGHLGHEYSALKVGYPSKIEPRTTKYKEQSKRRYIDLTSKPTIHRRDQKIRAPLVY